MREKAILWYSGGREVVDVGFVVGVFTFNFVYLHSTKAQPYENVILIVCTYCTLLATLMNLEV